MKGVPWRAGGNKLKDSALIITDQSRDLLHGDSHSRPKLMQICQQSWVRVRRQGLSLCSAFTVSPSPLQLLV